MLLGGWKIYLEDRLKAEILGASFRTTQQNSPSEGASAMSERKLRVQEASHYLHWLQDHTASPMISMWWAWPEWKHVPAYVHATFPVSWEGGCLLGGSHGICRAQDTRKCGLCVHEKLHSICKLSLGSLKHFSEILPNVVIPSFEFLLLPTNAPTL